MSPSRLRLLLLACTLVLVVVALQVPAYAGGGGGLGTCGPNNAIYYYSDASHTTLVGTCEPDCCNCSTCTCTGSTSAYPVNVPVNWLWCPPNA